MLNKNQMIKFLAVFFMFFIASLGNAEAGYVGGVGNGPVMTDSDYENVCHQFVAEGRPLVKSYSDWMDAHSGKFTQKEFQERLLWEGPKGGDTAYLQLGFGSYRADGSTPIGPGQFNPYIYQYSAEIYAAYKQWRETGVQPPGTYNPGFSTQPLPNTGGKKAVPQVAPAAQVSCKECQVYNDLKKAYQAYLDAKALLKEDVSTDNLSEVNRQLNKFKNLCEQASGGGAI